MAGLFLRTFGGLALERGGQPVEGAAAQRRALGLLAAVGAAGARGITRDQAMLLLWPESSTERARGSLKQLLHEIRRLLDEPDVISSVAELRLNRAVMDCDVLQFREALDQGDDARAVRLYTGPFLAGIHISDADEFERWADDERVALARLHAAALERLAARAADAGRAAEALAHWQQLHTLDPLNARIAIGLMRALDAAGDRAGALRLAASFQSAFQDQMGAPPDPAVQALAGELRQPRSVTPSRPAPATGVAALGPRADETASATSRRRVRPRIAALAVLGTLAAVLALVMRPATPDDSDNGSIRPNRVAVAVFVNRTGSPELDNLGTMAADWVTRGLARNPELDVFEVAGLYLAGRDTGGGPTDPRALARRMGAGLVVAGNYYASGPELTFSAQVVDVATGRVLRAVEPIRGSADNPLSVVEEIRRRTATALGTILDPRISAHATPSLVPPRYEAFEAFVKGQELYWRGDWAASLPHFRLAAQLDTSFLPALVLVGVVGVGTAQCHLADSVLAVFEDRPGVPEVDLLAARISVARCASDHEEHNRLHRLRAALLPNSKLMRLTMSTGFRQLNRPAEALEILEDIDPASDLGFLRDGGRSFFWREIAANQHALGEYRAELATADRMVRFQAARLATEFFRARSFAALGMTDSAINALDRLSDAPPDPPLLSGITGALDATQLAVPGWAMFQTALEFDAHGFQDAARIAAQRSIDWFARNADVDALSFTQRLVLARAFDFVGQRGQALSLLERLVAEDSTSVDARGVFGQVHTRLGNLAAANAVDAWMARQTNQFPPGLPLYYRATLAALRGDNEAALQFIEALPSRAHPLDFLHFHVDPALASLRREPTFRRLLTPRG
jgi:DNA-binding SARP family transcriptional activator/TolB-like protein